jgi:hypothetical protein
VTATALLVFARSAGMVFRAPGFSHPSVPPPVRAGLALALCGTFIVWWTARRQLKNGEFFDRLNVSLNILGEASLRLRTISERPLATVIDNSEAREAIIRAAKTEKKKAATEKREPDPVLRLPKDDAPYILRCIVNHTAERFSAGPFRQDCGQPVSPTWYAVCLTSERSDDDQLKIRALRLKEEHIKAFPLPEERDDDLELEDKKHIDRVKALRRASTLYQEGTHPHLFGRMEICL